ncbi:hypothetical protein APHAL10511_008741 [Amanita phalloides]|nr:hypothetical protein APHAL10511_008741 [Amanita phalloides]
MIEQRGDGQGSYIFGHSVHNIHIEHLWVELRHILVSKWKPFFESLEWHHGLNIDSAGHIWLLHHLFLDPLNEDILEWAEHWNAHIMHLKYESNKSPHQMFLMGLREREMTAMDVQNRTADEEVHDPKAYGIDYEALEDGELIDHMLDWDKNPFDNHTPDRFNKVQCDPLNCPLEPDEVHHLDATIAQEYDITTYNMDIQKMIWVRALSICFERVML